MQEYDFCKELKGVYKHSLFDNENIRYYLNGFMEALGINLDYGEIEQLGFKKMIDKDNNRYISDVLKKENDNCEITITKNNGKKDWIGIRGKTDNLLYCFDVFYNMRNINKKNNLPFEMSIEINEDGNYYSMIVCSSAMVCLNFVGRIKKNYSFDNYSFYTNRVNFEFILSLMMKFLENPDYVINLYKNVKNRKGSIYMTSSKLYTDNDIILDKNGKKYEKVLK